MFSFPLAENLSQVSWALQQKFTTSKILNTPSVYSVYVYQIDFSPY